MDTVKHKGGNVSYNSPTGSRRFGIVIQFERIDIFNQCHETQKFLCFS